MTLVYVPHTTMYNSVWPEWSRDLVEDGPQVETTLHTSPGVHLTHLTPGTRLRRSELIVPWSWLILTVGHSVTCVTLNGSSLTILRLKSRWVSDHKKFQCFRVTGYDICGSNPNQTAICVTNTFCRFVLQWFVPLSTTCHAKICVLWDSIVQNCDTNVASQHQQGLDLIRYPPCQWCQWSSLHTLVSTVCHLISLICSRIVFVLCILLLLALFTKFWILD